MLYNNVVYRKAWINLGSMSQQDARLAIVRLLEAANPQIKTTVLGRLKEKKEEEERTTRSGILQMLPLIL